MTVGALLFVVSVQVTAQSHDLWRVVMPQSQIDPAGVDPTSPEPWSGPGSAQAKIAVGYLKQRDAKLAEAQKIVAELVSTVFTARDALNEAHKAELKQKLTELAGAPLDAAERALGEAISLEAKRLRILRKALAVAKAGGVTLPPTPDPALLATLDQDLRSDRPARAVKARVTAYRSLAAALVAYLAGDLLGSITKLHEAAKDAPELAIIHVYLGSFYYLARQPQQALAEWKRALELDPSDEEIRQAVSDFSTEGR